VAWWHRHTSSTTEARSGPVQAPAPADWCALPPIQRVLDTSVPLPAPDTFRDSLSSWRDPRFLAPLGHLVAADGPGGHVEGLTHIADGPFRGIAHGVFAPPPQRGSVAPTLGPAVQRHAAAREQPATPEAPSVPPSFDQPFPEPVLPTVRATGGEPPVRSHAPRSALPLGDIGARPAVAEPSSVQRSSAADASASTPPTPPDPVAASEEPPLESDTAGAPLPGDGASVTYSPLVAMLGATTGATPSPPTAAPVVARIPDGPTAAAPATYEPSTTRAAAVSPPVVQPGPRDAMPEPPRLPVTHAAASAADLPIVSRSGNEGAAPPEQPATSEMHHLVGTSNEDRARAPVAESPSVQRSAPQASAATAPNPAVASAEPSLASETAGAPLLGDRGSPLAAMPGATTIDVAPLPLTTVAARMPDGSTAAAPATYEPSTTRATAAGPPVVQSGPPEAMPERSQQSVTHAASAADLPTVSRSAGAGGDARSERSATPEMHHLVGTVAEPPSLQRSSAPDVSAATAPDPAAASEEPSLASETAGAPLLGDRGSPLAAMPGTTIDATPSPLTTVAARMPDGSTAAVPATYVPSATRAATAGPPVVQSGPPEAMPERSQLSVTRAVSAADLPTVSRSAGAGGDAGSERSATPEMHHLVGTVAEPPSVQRSSAPDVSAATAAGPAAASEGPSLASETAGAPLLGDKGPVTSSPAAPPALPPIHQRLAVNGPSAPSASAQPRHEPARPRRVGLGPPLTSSLGAEPHHDPMPTVEPLTQPGVPNAAAASTAPWSAPPRGPSLQRTTAETAAPAVTAPPTTTSVPGAEPAPPSLLSLPDLPPHSSSQPATVFAPTLAHRSIASGAARTEGEQPGYLWPVQRVSVTPPVVPAPAADPGPGRGPTTWEPAEAMPLQRMFSPGAVAVAAGLATDAGDGSVVFHPPPGDHPGEPHAVSEPSVQRDAAPVSTGDGPVVAAAPGAAAAAPAGAPAVGSADIEELARRLFDPLAARLKAELWLDRERAGLIADVRR